jgi:hypothetical protein
MCSLLSCNLNFASISGLWCLLLFLLLLNLPLYSWFILSLYGSHLISFPWFQFNDLQECYLQKRRQSADKPPGQQERDTNFINREGYSGGLDDFQSVLTTFTRYRYYYLSFCVIWTINSYIVGIERKKGHLHGRIKGVKVVRNS